MKTTLHCGDLVAKVLKAEGVTHVFGLSGGTGRPGVAVVTVGPGVVNSFPGVAIAPQTRAPVVVIAGIP